MRGRKPAPAMIVALCALVVALGGTALAVSASRSAVIRACANKRTGALRLAGKCRHGERSVTWNKEGVPGPVGGTGAPGAPGGTGKQGLAGANGATHVELRTAEITIPTGGIGSVTASCNPGEHVTGGGAAETSGIFEKVVAFIPGGKPEPSEPGETPTGWRSVWENKSGSTDTFQVYVLCAAP